MTPLDDQLRQTLAERASLLAPSPDPLAGVEARATRIRRRRATAAVAGAAAVVAAVALAVPSLVPGGKASKPPHFATTTPSASTAPVDPATWEYRGNDIPAATVETYRGAWQARHPGSTLTPLFGQVYEPSATQELVFVAHGPDGDRVGVVHSAPAGPDFQYDEELGTLRALAFVLRGDEVARVLVVAAPDTRRIAYRDSSSSSPTALTVLAPGVGTGPVAQERSEALVSVTRADLAIDEFAPFDRARLPGNLLTWQVRGADVGDPSTPELRTLSLELRTRFAAAFGPHDVDRTYYSPLFVGDTDSGVRYTVGQAWFEGETRATTVSYATGGTKGPVLEQYGFTLDAPGAVVALLRDLPGTSVDLLVVVPDPTTGQVSYAAAATGAFLPVTGQDHLEGVVVIDRAKDATEDRLEILDANGDRDNPLYRGAVKTLLAGSPVH